MVDFQPRSVRQIGKGVWNDNGFYVGEAFVEFPAP